MSSLLKFAIPTVTVSFVAVGSYLVFFKKEGNKESLKSLIAKEGKRIILEDNSENHDYIWEEIAKEYKKDNAISVKDISKSNVDKTHIKEYCKKTSSLTDVGLLIEYRTLCSRSSLIDQINEDLKSQNKAWLTSKKKSDWDSLKSSYGDDSNSALLIPQKGQESTKVQKAAITNELLMEWCQSVASKPFVSIENEDYKVANFNCTTSIS
ncbi:hypothetical protein HF1_13730 [Mycoplasma haemofelis str. Langford 1]|uniref:Uncharacterized protein n=1 Tax=Mycoplasma haemofelis (strain Langford 1) TaxID=941640 RepID=E8ZJR0_MYCHL|nr:hypothetical protein HF1_13730 [Mycoplasma haemofelis str. Langford 1]